MTPSLLNSELDSFAPFFSLFYSFLVVFTFLASGHSIALVEGFGRLGVFQSSLFFINLFFWCDGRDIHHT